VTGGATGIGLGATLALARAGAAVGVDDSKNEAAAAKAVEAIGEAGGRAIAVQADVAREPEVTAMVARVATEPGGLDILVNNAGWTKPVQLHRNLAGLTDDLLDTVSAVNVKGAFSGVRAAITPTAALPTTAETADAIVRLATTPAATGATIIVDGGLTALGPRT